MPFTLDEKTKLREYSKEITGGRELPEEVKKMIQQQERETTQPRGTLMKAIDYVNRPLYASAGFANQMIQGKGQIEGLKAAWKGFSGQERVFYSDVLNSAGVKNKYVRAVGGFALDVGFDPVTYLTFGIGSGAKLGLTTLSKSGKTFLNTTLKKQLPKLTELNVAKGMSKEIAEATARETIEEATLRTALKQPDKYVAKSAMKVLGKEIPVVSDFWKMTGKKVTSKLGKVTERFYQKGPLRWAGEAFIGEKFIIKHAKDLTSLQKNMLTLYQQQAKSRILLGGELAMQKSLQMAKEVPNVADRELIANAIEQAAKAVPLSKKGFTEVYRGGITYVPKKVTKEGISITTSKSVAESFQRKFGRAKEAIDVLYLDKKAKIMPFSKIKGMGVLAFKKHLGWLPLVGGEEKILKYARKKGYDAVDLTQLGYKFEKEIRVINPKILKTETDFGIRTLADLVPKHLVKKAEDIEKFIFKEITEPEARKGLIQSFKEGYIPHYYKQKLAGMMSKDIPNPIIARNKSGRVRIFETMQEATAAGWQPIEDYAVSVGLRNAYSKRVIAVDDYVQKMLSTTATPINKKSAAWKQMIKTKRVPEGMSLYMPRGGARFYPLYNSGKTKVTQVGNAKAIRKLFEAEGTGGFFGGELLKELRLTPVQTAFRLSDDIPVYLLPKDVADMMNAASPYMTREKNINSFLKFSDGVMSIWKTSVTSWWPGFHSRNAMSNVWLAWLGGLNDPRKFAQSARLQWYDYMTRKGKDMTDFTATLAGEEYKASQLVKMGKESGVLNRGWFGAEMGHSLEKEIMMKTGVKPRLTGKQKGYQLARDIVVEKPRAAGTAVENNARFALFLDQIDKGFDITAASQHTKKFLFDYGELTKFEKKVMKRIFPFYTWVRKNIPLEVEQLFKQPGKFGAIGKTKAEIESLSEAPDEKYLPEWMREKELFVRLPYESPDKPFYMNFDFAFQDLSRLNFVGKPLDTLREWYSFLRPDLKALTEIATNYNVFFGRNVVDPDLPDEIKFRELVKEELLSNMRITGYWRKFEKQDIPNVHKVLDFFLGLKPYPYDEAKSKYYYYQRKEREQRALQKHQLKKRK